MLQPDDTKKKVRRVHSFNGFSRKESSKPDAALFVFRSPHDSSPSIGKKHHHVRNTQHWNETKEATMKWLGQRAGGYKWMHAQAARKYSRAYNYIGITAIIANVIATALNVPYIVQCSPEYGWSKILSLIIAAIVTAIMSYQQFKDFGAVQAQHITSEANYGALYDTIKAQLERNANDRQNADDFVEWITKQLGDLKSSSPLVPAHILDEYRSMMAGRNFADPEGIDDIIINRDDDSSESLLAEIVIEGNQVPPRSGILIPPPIKKESAPSVFLSPGERLAFERWNEQEEQ